MSPSLRSTNLVLALLIAGHPQTDGLGAVEGLVTRNGVPEAQVVVKLLRERGGEAGLTELKTDERGRYAFEGVRTGDYSLLIRVVADGAVRCETSSSDFVITPLTGKNPQGRTVTLATARSKPASFRLGSRERVKRDLALSCATRNGKE